MKKIYLTLAACALCLGQSDAQSKLDLEAHRMLDRSKGVTFILDDDRTGRNNSRGENGQQKASVIIELAAGADTGVLEMPGVEITGHTGNLVIADVDPAALEAIAALDEVTAISGAKTLTAMMDNARAASYVDDIHDGTGLDMPYTGKGVIVSLFDKGLDPNHVNFMDDDQTQSRVKRIWEYNTSKECTEYATSDKIRTFTSDDAYDTHGTHVLGTIAGSYNGNSEYAFKGLLRPTVKTGPMPYYGIARDADIAIGCGTLLTTNILSGIERITEYAAAENKPAVVNLSLGLLEGPQDGTDLTCKYLADLGKKAIIVLASGNDGDSPLTVSKTLTGADNTVKTFVDLENARQKGQVSIWGSDSRVFTVKMAVVSKLTGEVQGSFVLDHSTSNSTMFYTTSNYTSPEYIHDEAFDRAFQSSNIQAASNVSATNNRYNVQVGYDLTPNSTTNAGGELTFGLIIEGAAGQRIDISTTSITESGHGYLTSHRINGWEDGSGVMSISGMACGDNVIVVGAYNSRSQWGNLDKASYSYLPESGLTTVGDISTFTSSGVTVTGRSLPDVCAPGAGIISSYSSYYVANAVRSGAMQSANDTQGYADANGKRHYWALSQGTSMACPSVTGIIALWLEADPSLTVNEVRNIIKATAVKDKFVDDNVQWGAGKIDALAGIKKVLDDKAGVGSIFVDDERNLIVTPLDGGYNVYVAGESMLTVTVYDAAGRTVAAASADGNSVDVDTSSLRPGVYILSAQGNTQRHTAKIAVK